MATRTKLTVRLPEENVKFVKRYAAEHGLTVTSVLNRFLIRLRESSAGRGLHPDVERISGLVPPDVDAEALYHDHLLDKHK